MIAKFEAKIALGIEGSVAIMLLDEQDFIDGLYCENSDLVLADIRENGASQWFGNVQPESSSQDVGVYLVQGEVRFYESSSDYFNVQVRQIS
ncbi:hypothetical protein LMH73_020325 [Vibrio splendidus]|nr:hypothetical protein [Vibrio splendidus]MCC4880554.1 hypothetical protein [Vibrio splendidus]